MMEVRDEFALSLIGMKEDAAIRKCIEFDRNTRVTRKNGLSFMVTSDHSPNRINLHVMDGIVETVYLG